MGGYAMAVNYTQDQVDYIVNEYTLNPDRETVEKLADELNKSVKSIIGKLSREGVYKKTEYTTKTGEKPITKLQIVENLAEKLAIPNEALAGLEKAPKTVLRRLYESM